MSGAPAPLPVLRAGFYISTGILSGRAVGFCREALLASSYGVGQNADLAVLMLTVPDLLVSILMGGALSVALIPEIKRLDESDAGTLFLQSSVLVGVVFTLAALVLYLAALPLVRMLVPGFSPEMSIRATDSLRLVLWVVPLTTLAGVTTAFAQAYDRFAVPAFGTLIVNGVIVAGLFWGRERVTLPLLAGLIVAGALIRWLSQVAVVPRFHVGRARIERTLISRQIVIHYYQAVAAGGVILLFPVVARALASFQGLGSVASLNYATKLVEFPLGICVSVLSIILFPRLAKIHEQNKDELDYQRTVTDGVSLVLICAVGMMIPMLWFNNDLTDLLYGRGKMPTESLREISALAFVGLLSIPAQGISSIVIAAFNARRDTSAPLFLNGGGLLLFAGLGAYLSDHYGLRGLMVGLTTMNWLLALSQIILLQTKHGIHVLGIIFAGRTLLILATVALAFVPLAAIAFVTPGGPLVKSLWAASGCAVCIATGVIFQEGGIARVWRDKGWRAW